MMMFECSDPGAAPDVVLVATGSEVSLACDAAAKLSAEGVRARLTSWFHFADSTRLEPADGAEGVFCGIRFQVQ